MVKGFWWDGSPTVCHACHPWCQGTAQSGGGVGCGMPADHWRGSTGRYHEELMGRLPVGVQDMMIRSTSLCILSCFPSHPLPPLMQFMTQGYGWREKVMGLYGASWMAGGTHLHALTCPHGKNHYLRSSLLALEGATLWEKWHR